MKKIFIPLMTVAVVAALLFGCVPEAAPPVAPPVTPPVTPPAPEVATLGDVPELQDLIAKGLVDPNALLNPFEGLAIKPDGTPYRIAITYWSMVCEAMVNWDGVNKATIEKAGGEWLFQNPEEDPAPQIAFIEDRITARDVDALLLHCVYESALAPAAAKCQAAGIPVVHFDRDMRPFNEPDEYVSTVYHDFAGPEGTNLVGQFFCDYADKHDMDIHVFESWTYRAAQTCVDRDTGLKAAILPHPRVTLTESGPEDFGSSERCMNHCIDAMTADPTINAIFVQDGGGPGAIEAVRTLGRLYTVDHPDHVVLAFNDTDSGVMDALEEGYFDAMGTHGGYHLAACGIQTLLTHLCCGAPVPKGIAIPMDVVTPANKDTLMCYGATPVWPWLPVGEWDKWPVLDFTEFGVAIPTTALRMQYLGY